jgi:flotillin
VVSTAKVLHGGGAFIWPVIQDYQWLSLKPIPIDIDLRNALSKQNIRIDVPSTFTIAVSTDPDVMINAAERLLGMDNVSISGLAKDIILGQLRLVIATMDIEEINSDRDKFLSAIQNNLEGELDKVGLRLMNVNITDIQDESGYISALGKEAASKAINDAKVSVAKTDRDGAIGATTAQKDMRIQTSDLKASAEIGEANAFTNTEIGKSEVAAKQRAKVAEYNANAIGNENESAILVAESASIRLIAEAEATKNATTAKNIATANTERDSYNAQREAEDARSAKTKSTLMADIVVPAEIAKQKLIVEAEAEADQMRSIAQGKADAVILEKTAEAEGIAIILEKQAEGIAKYITAAGSSEAAIQMMMVDKLPELMRIQVDAIKNIKIDKITVWDSGSGNGSGNTSATGDLLKGIMTSLPAFDDLYKSMGKSLPGMFDISGEEDAVILSDVDEKLPTLDSDEK